VPQTDFEGPGPVGQSTAATGVGLSRKIIRSTPVPAVDMVM
jgi:hypothetical protein